ncbi:MAG: amidohydrolase [Eubacteriales bacterium]|nr:amidohydrolase [Eubacteriales bacterium]
MIKQEIYDEVQGLQSLLQSSCRQLWKNPELGGNEKKSSAYCRKVLEKEGFTIVNSKEMPYAFYAEYGNGSPVIAVLGEYDALPGFSQTTSTVKESITEGAPGHACGHNLLGSAAMVGAIAIKRYLEQSKTTGTVRFYGCPEEELLCGKVKMIAEGMFDGCDVGLSWHPMDANLSHASAYLANASVKFYFHGVTSHAAFAPERGRSALDAVELTSVGCNYLREHVVDRTRIHYTTDSGGFAPNIVPDKASAWYFVRAPHISDVKDTLKRVERVAQGAAMMTDTTVDIEEGYGCCEFLENNAFAELSYLNMIEADGPKYTQKELDFAKELQASVAPAIVSGMQSTYNSNHPNMFMGVGSLELSKKCTMSASSDTGDVSFIMPTGLFTTACWPIGCSPHTWQTASCAGTTIGEKGALYAAKIIAGTAYDLLNKPEYLQKIKKEFDERTNPDYAPMVASKKE